MSRRKGELQKKSAGRAAEPRTTTQFQASSSDLGRKVPRSNRCQAFRDVTQLILHTCYFEQYGQLAHNGSIGPAVSNYSSVAVFLRNEILVHADHDDSSLRPQSTAPIRSWAFHCRPSSECPSTTKRFIRLPS